MKKTALILRNFLILNVMVLIPFVGLVLWHHPEQLFLFVETPVPLSIGIGTMVSDENGSMTPLFSRSVGCAVGLRDVPSAQVYMTQPNDDSRLCYRFTGEAGSFTVRHAILIKHLFLRQDMTGNDFCRDYRGMAGVTFSTDGNGGCVISKGKDAGTIGPRDEAHWGKPRLTFAALTPNMRLCLIGLEFGVLLLSSLGILLKRRYSVSSNLGLSALLAAIFGCTVFLVLPLQTFLANQSAFPCATSDVIQSGAVHAMMLFILIFCMLFGSSLVLDRILMAVVVGVLIFEYLQTGILSASYPSMNGDILFYRNSTGLIVRDYVLLGVLIMSPLAAYRYVKGYLHWIALAIFLLFAVSLFDVRPAKDEVYGGIPTAWTNTVEEVFASARFSPKRNVMLLVPDTLQSDVAVDVVAHNPDIARKFSGFTAFVNNIGMHEFTAYGMPGLLRGEYYDGIEPLDTYIARATGKGSIVTDYAAQGWPCYVYAHFGVGMFTNRIKDGEGKFKTAKVQIDNALLVRQNGTPYLNLFDIIMFRLAPFGMKERVNAKNTIGLGSSHDFFLESSLYPVVETAPTDETLEATFHLYHSNGLHTPIMYDRNGNQAHCAQTYEAMREQAIFVMNRIGHLCDILRERNLFDQTMIVIAADHGSGVSAGKVMDGDEISGRLIPILWVKPFGARGEIAFNAVATSHSKIRDMVESAMERNLQASEIAQELQVENRLWRQFANDEVVDYMVDARGKVKIETFSKKEMKCRK